MNKDEILNMPAGREMDTLIAKYIFGNVKKHWDFEFTLPSYSTDISAAWQVVEKMSDGETPNDVELRTSVRGWRCDFFKGYANDETAPLAICKAALLAIINTASILR